MYWDRDDSINFWEISKLRWNVSIKIERTRSQGVKILESSFSSIWEWDDSWSNQEDSKWNEMTPINREVSKCTDSLQWSVLQWTFFISQWLVLTSNGQIHGFLYFKHFKLGRNAPNIKEEKRNIKSNKKKRTPSFYKSTPTSNKYSLEHWSVLKSIDYQHWMDFHQALSTTNQLI